MIDTPAQGTSDESGAELRSLIAILDPGAVAFCHYQNPRDRKSKPQWMPPDVLEKTVRFAAARQLRLVCLLGRRSLPRKYASILRKIPCSYIQPLGAKSARPASDTIYVLEANQVSRLKRACGRDIDNAILRLERKDLPRLASLFADVAGRIRRMNICLLDLEQYREEDFEIYKKQLAAMVDTVADLNWPQRGTECNLLTDRLVLTAMNNCDAGLKHLTVAPNGRLYLCPGFYFWREDQSLGSLDDALHIPNLRLLSVDGAPICRRCDAFHCRRCLLLNKQLTDEINTPSHQQCTAAHCEREASRILLQRLRDAGRLGQTAPVATINELAYLDPFELIERGGKSGGPAGQAPNVRQGQQVVADVAMPTDSWSELRALLLELRAGQREILRALQANKEQKP